MTTSSFLSSPITRRLSPVSSPGATQSTLVSLLYLSLSFGTLQVVTVLDVSSCLVLVCLSAQGRQGGAIGLMEVSLQKVSQSTSCLQCDVQALRSPSSPLVIGLRFLTAEFLEKHWTSSRESTYSMSSSSDWVWAGKIESRSPASTSKSGYCWNWASAVSVVGRESVYSDQCSVSLWLSC
ncbi:hypothetical protein FGO68_gene14247 [Halteria grandinella]|uniref:Uncharacterized protein n=1 Tax=Halteria grandinella TaxID=5974 RepID=A0A8J8T7X4_HALGN|nr:hypothetical protein FGO68_gene14247 [Halteria grandinella]